MLSRIMGSWQLKARTENRNATAQRIDHRDEKTDFLIESNHTAVGNFLQQCLLFDITQHELFMAREPKPKQLTYRNTWNDHTPQARNLPKHPIVKSSTLPFRLTRSSFSGFLFAFWQPDWPYYFTLCVHAKSTLGANPFVWRKQVCSLYPVTAT